MTESNTTDTVLPFLFHNTPIRGRVCKLDKVLNQILLGHHYPEDISYLLAEAILLNSIIGSMNNKSPENTTTLQIKSDGPLDLLIIDYFDHNKMRVYIGYNAENYKELIHNKPSPNLLQLFNNGYLAITLNHHLPTRYQGIVELDKVSLTACVENYFLQSEQINTLLRVSIGQKHTKNGIEWCGGGIIIQTLPDDSNKSVDFNHTWEELKILTETIRHDELIDPTLPGEEILYRLYNQHETLLLPAENLIYQCRCSREKAVGIFNSIPQEDLASFMIDDHIEIKCEFCGKKEFFLEEDHPNFAGKN